MKKTILKVVAVALASLYLFSCSNTGSALSKEKQVINSIVNSTVVMSAGMMIAMQSQMSPTSDGADIKAKSKEMITGMVDKFSTVFSTFETEHPELYQKMASNPEVLKGISISEKYNLPSGFKAYTENMSIEDLSAYVNKMAEADPEAEPAADDVVALYMQEMAMWSMTMNQTLKADPEFAAIMQQNK